MAYLNDEAVWETGVRRLEETDNCEAGVFNEPLGQLTRRTKALRQMVEAETYARGQNDAAMLSRLNAVEGRGGPLPARDFESEMPSQAALTQYACAAIWGEGGVFTWNAGSPAASTYAAGGVTHTAVEIFNATWVRNTYNGINHRIVLTNTQDTQPAVFVWEDVGYDTVGIATAALAGLVKSGGDVEIDPVTGLMSVKGGVGASFSPDGWGLVSDGRNLLEVLGVSTVADAVEALHQKINADGVPDFSGLQIGDYLDLASLNDGSTTYTWNESYKNLRIVIAGFNTYKSMGGTENAKNHIVFVFENCPLTKAMHSSNDNAGGYPSSTLRTYLEGGFLTGLVEALGHDYMYSVRRYISNKGSYTELNAKIFLPTEIEVYGMQINGDELGDSATDYQYVNPIQLPVFRDSYKHRIKRYNGSRQWWWLSTPYSAGSTSYCAVHTQWSCPQYQCGFGWRLRPRFLCRLKIDTLFLSRPLVGRAGCGCHGFVLPPRSGGRKFFWFLRFIFMSVLKNKRGLSKLEFYHNARKLRRDITNLLLRDFGVRDKIRKTKTADGEPVTVIDGYPDWLIDKFRDSIMRILRDLIMNITAGNTIYPTNDAELQTRRHYQTQAIINCEQLLQEMHYCEDMLPVHVTKFMPFVDAIEFEITLLRGWRKSNSKITDRLKK